MIKDNSGNTRFYGVYRGIVKDTRDPLNKNRVRLQVPQVLSDQVTGWAWPVIPVGGLTPESIEHGSGTGDSHTHSSVQVRVWPKVGDGVFVMFEGGDPSFPIWLGSFVEGTP